MLEQYHAELMRYLPRDIYMGESLDYQSYYSQAIYINGKNDLHTIEYFSFHILWMAFLQKVTFDLYSKDPDGVKRAFSSEGTVLRVLEDARVSYDLSVINEKKLCEICKHPYINYRFNKISNLRTLVDKRDHIAHCSGVLDLDKDEVENLSKQCVRYTKEIYDKVKNLAEEHWAQFIDSIQEDESQYTLVHDAVIEHVSSQSYSIADINQILVSRKMGINMTEKIALFHLSLYIEDYDLETDINPEDYKNNAINASSDDDEKARVQDEHEAYVTFRMGLVKS